MTLNILLGMVGPWQLVIIIVILFFLIRVLFPAKTKEEQKEKAANLAKKAKEIEDEVIAEVDKAKRAAYAAGNTTFISAEERIAVAAATNAKKYAEEAINFANRVAETKKFSEADTLLTSAKSSLENAKGATNKVKTALEWINKGEEAIRKRDKEEEIRDKEEEIRRKEEEIRRKEEEDMTTCKQCGKNYDPYSQWARPPFCCAMCRATYNGSHGG